MLALLSRLGLPVWILLPAGFVLGSLGAGWFVHQLWSGKYARHIAADATALAKAANEAREDQARLDKITLNAAVAAAEAQEKEIIKTVTITKWAIKNVPIIAGCPGPELIRLHNAAATGANPESDAHTP